MEELEFTVEDLIDGGEYEFRVKAVNAAGVSKPSDTVGPVIVKDQTCKYWHINREFPLYEYVPRYSVRQNEELLYLYLGKVPWVECGCGHITQSLIPSTSTELLYFLTYYLSLI